ncbi:MAG TPA: NAD-dependent epimerase/dehydratase family protein, partial [Vicinamibacterales bacterium]|nr:NAD-dependent epimerase/dehydratase family protein [Vicinamibacterales bacterium]
MSDNSVLVTGAGGFIGGHLVDRLRSEGRHVRAVDVKPLSEWYQLFDDVDRRRLDLRDRASCDAAVAGVREVYNLACDMGGMGFIETHKAECMISVLINTHMLMAARDA